MTGPAGALRLVGRLVDASNGTFLAADEQDSHWVYKPVAGEAPLWDFPMGTLGRREVAAHALSEELGLGVVPLTVWADGPLGEGSAQQWIDGPPTELIDLLDPTEVDEAWLPILTGLSGDDRPVVLAHRDDPQLRAMALFDVLLNNSDRKASHVIARDGALSGVDHGVSLHTDPSSAPSCGAGRGTRSLTPNSPSSLRQRPSTTPSPPGWRTRNGPPSWPARSRFSLRA